MNFTSVLLEGDGGYDRVLFRSPLHDVFDDSYSDLSAVTDHIYNIVEKEDGTLGQSLQFNVFPDSPYYNALVPSVKDCVTVEDSNDTTGVVRRTSYWITHTVRKMNGQKTCYAYVFALLSDFCVREETNKAFSSGGSITTIMNEFANDVTTWQDSSITSFCPRFSGAETTVTNFTYNNKINDVVGKNLYDLAEALLRNVDFKVVNRSKDGMTFRLGKESTLIASGKTKTATSEAISDYEEELNIKNVYTTSMAYVNVPSGVYVEDSFNAVGDFARWNAVLALQRKYGKRVQSTKIDYVKGESLANLKSRLLTNARTMSGRLQDDQYRIIRLSLNPAYFKTDFIRLYDKIDINSRFLTGIYAITKLERCIDNPAKTKLTLKGA